MKILFCKHILSCIYFYFQKLIWFSFCPLHLDHCISSKYCNYVVCSTDQRKSNGNNYTIIRHCKNILWQEKARITVSSKFRVDKGKNSWRKLGVFWRSFWLQSCLENFLDVVRTCSVYVKHAPRSREYSAFRIRVARHTEHFLMTKVLTPPP